MDRRSGSKVSTWESKQPRRRQRGRRGRRPSVTRRRIHQRTRITRSLARSSGEKERERGNIRGRIVQDVVEPALVARFPGRGAETRRVRRLAWRVNDSVRLILQLQLEIAKMNEPADASEEAALVIASSAIFSTYTPCSRFSRECHRTGRICSVLILWRIAYQRRIFFYFLSARVRPGTEKIARFKNY